MSIPDNSYARLSRDLSRKLDNKMGSINKLTETSGHASSYQNDAYSVRDPNRGNARTFFATDSGIVGGFGWPITAV